MRVPLAELGRWCPDVAERLSTGNPLDVARQVAAVLVGVGLEEEGLHLPDLRGPLVVGEVLSVVPEPQKNGKTINWCQVRVGPNGVEDTTGSQDGDVRGIVCGAPNFGPGDRVVVALPGAVLPGGFEIAARRTYGHVSDGMICSERELGMGEDHTGILVLGRLGIARDDPAAQPGADALALLGLDTPTLEVNVTPDRGYWLSIRGVAREYALATKPMTVYVDPADSPAAKASVLPADVVQPGGGHVVRIADDSPLRGRSGCDRYVAHVVTGFDPSGITPLRIRRVLQQCGMRPISLAVDVTNYVMLVTGQPLHAFDRDALAGSVVVRRSRPEERLRTLDGTDRVLHPEDLLITDEVADGTSRVLALAGVMGGASTEVTEGTTSLLIEAAHFDPITVARTARRHKLSTEASRRFERGVDDDLPDRAAALAVRLLIEHGGGRAGAVTDVDERLARPVIVTSADLSRRLIGVPLADDEVREALVRVGCRVEDDGDRWAVSPPSWRPDLRLGADLVEEVARVHGYDRIPSILPAAPAGAGLTRGQRLRRSAARALAEQGFVEVLTYPFVGSERHDAMGLTPDDPRRIALTVANPLNERLPQLRTSLLDTLPDAAQRNLSRGVRDLAVFEIGRVFRPRTAPALIGPGLAAAARGPGPAPGRPTDQVLAALMGAVPPQPLRVAVLLAGDRRQDGWWGPARAADWSDAVGAAQALAGSLGLGRLEVAADQHPPWHPGRCARLMLPGGALVGHAGELAPAVVEALQLPPRTCAAELDLELLIQAVPETVAPQDLSTYPVARRDVALVVSDEVPAAVVERALRDGGGPLVEDVRLFDVYSGPQVGQGSRSLAYSLVLRAPDRTLTGDEAEAARDAAVAAAARVGAALRQDS
jgi:phenylalanyl-tRNA synthetase beta chain